MAKATPAQMKRDHAISRGKTRKGREYQDASLLVDKNMARMEREVKSKKKRKGIDKRKGLRYTVRVIINKIKEGIQKMSDKNQTNNNNKPAKKVARNGIPVHGLAGLALLFVSVSIVYANYVVFFGTTGLVPKLMLIPSSLFVLAYLIYKSLK